MIEDEEYNPDNCKSNQSTKKLNYLDSYIEEKKYY